MAKFKISPDLGKYDAKIYALGAQATECIEAAVKEGANPVADAVRAALNALPVDDSYHKPGELRQGPRTIQKTGMQAGLGISPVRDDSGFINVKIGFHGYNGMRTKKYPGGQPNAMIARSVEKGTSYMTANPFIDKAVKSARAEAEKIMKQEIEKSIDKIMGD